MRVYNELFSDEIWEQVNSKNKDLLEDFLLELKSKKRSSGTISQYGYNLRGFMCYLFNNFDNKSVLDLSKKDFRKYSIFLTEDCGVSNARYNVLVSCIHSMLDYAEQDDDFEYENNLSRRIRGLPREPIKEIVFLKDDIVLSLYEKYMNEERFYLATLLSLAYDSAGRKSELYQVKKSSFLSNKNNTNVVVGKGRKKFSLIYFSKTKEAVSEWLKIRGCDDIESLWVSDGKCWTSEDIYKWFSSMKDDISNLGIDADYFSPHSMRHSSLTNYGNGTHYVCRELGISGFPIEKLKLIAHHDNVDTTRGYLPDTSMDELEDMFRISIKV